MYHKFLFIYLYAQSGTFLKDPLQTAGKENKVPKNISFGKKLGLYLLEIYFVSIFKFLFASIFIYFDFVGICHWHCELIYYNLKLFALVYKFLSFVYCMFSFLFLKLRSSVVSQINLSPLEVLKFFWSSFQVLGFFFTSFSVSSFSACR